MIEFKSPLYSEFTGELEGLVRYLDYGNEKLARRERELTLQHFHRMHPCCPPEVLREGLNFLLEKSKSGRVVYPLYELSECREDERKKEVRLFAFASEESKRKPAVIVCAGGGYGYVCNLVEGFPVAMRFARLGYPVFVLNYRVGRPPVLPMRLFGGRQPHHAVGNGQFGLRRASDAAAQSPACDLPCHFERGASFRSEVS